MGQAGAGFVPPPPPAGEGWGGGLRRSIWTRHWRIIILPPMEDDAELVIAGAGLTGMLLAVACAGVGLEVAIVDPQDPAAMLEAGFDSRASAIAYGSRPVLRRLAPGPDIAAESQPTRPT